jgi:DNA-binding transcriptional ArsR family regulator
LFNYLVKYVLNFVVALSVDSSYYVDVGKKSIASKQISTEQRAKVFKALSDPTRLRIIEMLSDCDQMCGSEIAKKLGISLALLCHHWTTLEHSGLITKTKEGQTASISLNRQLLLDSVKGVVD